MDIKLMRCDTPSANNRVYPLKVVRDCIKKFNRHGKTDSIRNVYFCRNNNPSPEDLVLGYVLKLKLKGKVLIAEFEFSDDPYAQNCKAFYDQCIAKGIDPSFFDYRIMMDCLGELEPGDSAVTYVFDLEVFQFCFGLDSSWQEK